MQAGLFGDEKQSENQVEAELIKFMQSEGWRPTRNHVGLFRTMQGHKVSIGTKGFPDWTFTRGYKVSPDEASRRKLELVHVEAKKPGEKPAKIQREVMASLNHLGELATWTDNVQNFKKWYRTHFEN